MVNTHDSEELGPEELKTIQGAGFDGVVCPSVTEKGGKKRILSEEPDINIRNKRKNTKSRST